MRLSMSYESCSIGPDAFKSDNTVLCNVNKEHNCTVSKSNQWRTYAIVCR